MLNNIFHLVELFREKICEKEQIRARLEAADGLRGYGNSSPYFRKSELKIIFLKFNVAWQTIKWSLVIKHINWLDNHQKTITVKYDSHHFTGYGENAM